MPLRPAFTFESAPVPALLLELDGTILLANETCARLASRSLEEIIGSPIRRFIPSFEGRWSALVERAQRDGSVVDETDITTREGLRHLQFVLTILQAGGRDVVQALAIDVTSYKASAQQQSTQRLESLGLVAGGIAHDFNNLLVGVLAEASAAREDAALGENTREALRRIEAAARRMSQLTRQLLAYAGRGQFVTAPLAPDDLVQELREQLVRSVPTTLTLDVAPTASGRVVVVVEADPGLLRQVVMNLVSNASDAARTRIGVTTSMVVRDNAPWWQLEVVDDGVGIEATTLGRIFEPFFTTKPGRHGLGLSAVHGIVRRLGGHVEVDSTRDVGSRFRVRLPIVPNAEPQRRIPTEQGMTPQKLAGLRVLVADDEPSVRATVRRLLERRGATVIVAVDGSEAEARIAEERFDLLVLDVSMPGRTGHEVMATARAAYPGIPIVLMSGYTERIRGEGGEEEADLFLEKPFTARVLDTGVDDVMKGKRRR